MSEYGKLLRRSSIALALCFVAVLLCYFWIDRSVAFFVHRHHIDEMRIFRWFTYPPPEVQTWSPLVLTFLFIRRAWNPWLRWQKDLLVACLSLLVADQFRICLGDVCGRYWPETWRHDNPSLIGTGTYGFHPFQRGDDIGSFPSGPRGQDSEFCHGLADGCAAQLALVAVIALPMLASLVAMNYDFVGDVIAGGVLGGVVATYAVHLARMRILIEGEVLVTAPRRHELCRSYFFKSAAISANWASAAWRSSTISAAMISGSGRFALASSHSALTGRCRGSGLAGH